MKLDDSKLRDALTAIHPGPLTRAEAAAIVDVARYAASVDGRMDMGEMATVARLSKIIYAMSGEDEVPVPATQVPASWLGGVGKTFAAASSRELAYTCARLVIVADNKVTKEETELGSTLIKALGIAEARAGALDRIIDSLVGTVR